MFRHMIADLTTASAGSLVLADFEFGGRYCLSRGLALLVCGSLQTHARATWICNSVLPTVLGCISPRDIAELRKGSKPVAFVRLADSFREAGGAPVW